MKNTAQIIIYLITAILIIISGLFFPNIKYLKSIIIFIFIISLLIFNYKKLSTNKSIFFVLTLVLMASLFVLRTLFNQNILDDNTTLIILLVICILFVIVIIFGIILVIKEKR